jgi:hypothetical protein
MKTKITKITFERMKKAVCKIFYDDDADRWVIMIGKIYISIFVLRSEKSHR